MAKLIPLEEVIKLLNTRSHYFYGDEERENFRFAIDSLPTINPIKEIDKMIEELENEEEYTQTVTDYARGILEELKSRLESDSRDG